MDIETVREWCLVQKGAVEAFPFDATTLVFKVMGKLFALIPLERHPPQCNLKCDPERALELRTAYSNRIIPGYHMNKKHWNTLLIEELPPLLLRELITHSYQQVVAGLSKKLREQLSSL